MRERRARAPASVFAASVLALGILATACTATPYPTFDTEEHLRERFAERLGEEEALRVAIPFSLDQEILTAVDERLNRAASERRRVDQALDFVFGWLRLQYSLTPTRSAAQTFHAREGNCLSFVNLFVGIARHLRLNPFYVEVEDYQRWKYQEGAVVSHGHIVAGMYIDGQLSTFDFLPYRAKSYRDFQPIDDLRATAHFYNNLGGEALVAGDVARAEELLRIATELDPEFDKAVNNYGVVLLRTGRVGEAVSLYESALERSPENIALLTNAARAYQTLGRAEEAAALLARLEGLSHDNPFFYLYRGEAALAQGDLDTALDYMRKAFRRDTENPEVHVGLVKAFLAKGDLERARHHVERALTLDATHAEARTLAAMILEREGEGR